MRSRDWESCEEQSSHTTVAYSRHGWRSAVYKKKRCAGTDSNEREGALTLSRASMAISTVYGRWGLRHLNFVFICRMATRLRLKLRIELFFTVIKSFWGVHVQVLAEIFAQR